MGVPFFAWHLLIYPHLHVVPHPIPQGMEPDHRLVPDHVEGRGLTTAVVDYLIVLIWQYLASVGDANGIFLSEEIEGLSIQEPPAEYFIVS